MSSSVEQIKDRLSIVDVVGAYVTLEKSGRNLRARCPFHNERTPSFFVSPERGTYHCFGCDAGGDIFEFVEAFEGIDFYGALKILATKAGVLIVRSDPRAHDEKELLYHVLDEAAAFYEHVLAASPHAREYLRKRGATPASIKEWRLGFARDEWQGLLSFFSAKGIKEDVLEKAGLVIRSREGRYYDRFRGRIMFPIADSSGRVIAFSARLLPGNAAEGKQTSAPAGGFGEAKYINSPETELYHKSSALFGFDKAKQAIREKNACIIVEGQMDVLITHQAGARNAVATSGTALTEEHIGRIRRFTEKLVFAFDGDSAGLAATERGLKLALKEGMDVALVRLPQKKDPAELGAASPEDLVLRLENATHAVDFFLTALKETITDPRRLKIETGKKVLPLIARMKNRIEQAHFIAETARHIGVREDALWEELLAIRATTGDGESGKSAVSAGAAPSSGGGTVPVARSRKDAITERLIGVFLSQATTGVGVDFLSNAKQETEKLLGAPFSEIIKRFSENERERMRFEAERVYVGRGFKENDINELVENLKDSTIRARLRSATIALLRAENAHDEIRAKEISKEISALRKSIS